MRNQKRNLVALGLFLLVNLAVLVVATPQAVDASTCTAACAGGGSVTCYCTGSCSATDGVGCSCTGTGTHGACTGTGGGGGGPIGCLMKCP